MINNRLEIKNLAISFFSGFAGLFAYWFVIVIVEFPDIPFRFFIYGALVEEILKFSIILIPPAILH